MLGHSAAKETKQTVETDRLALKLYILPNNVRELRERIFLLLLLLSLLLLSICW